MTEGEEGSHESAEHQPTADRKMDWPNSINNDSPLTMTPKLLTLQRPLMAATTNTSHNVAHVPPDRNIVL